MNSKLKVLLGILTLITGIGVLYQYESGGLIIHRLKTDQSLYFTQSSKQVCNNYSVQQCLGGAADPAKPTINCDLC